MMVTRPSVLVHVPLHLHVLQGDGQRGEVHRCREADLQTAGRQRRCAVPCGHGRASELLGAVDSLSALCSVALLPPCCFRHLLRSLCLFCELSKRPATEEMVATSHHRNLMRTMIDARCAASRNRTRLTPLHATPFHSSR